MIKGIRTLATPGHTPGHTSLLIDTGGQQVLFGGDTFVHPVQISDVAVCFAADMDRAQAIATRTRLRAWLSQDNVLLASNHIAGSGPGHIVHEDQQYMWREIIL